MYTNMSLIDVLTTRQADGWTSALEQCALYDFYHLPAYHALAEEQGEGVAHLFLYREGAYRIALPLLLRDLDGLWSGPSSTPGKRDATSVYGYAGPVCSHPDIPEQVVHHFQTALRGWLRDLRVVNVFSRLHPLVPQRSLLAGLGDFAVSQTVSIDLTQSPAAQNSRMRRSFREAIKRLRRNGLTCMEDTEGSYLKEFCGIYHETMRRVGAAERYFFPLSYFERLREELGSRLHLFVCLWGGKAVCTGLFVSCNGILQYHLGATLDEALHLSPMKLLVDEVRQWATSQGMRILHLGGGTTSSPEDSLLFFKQGFSDRTHEFAAWRWIVLSEAHQRLCEEKARWNEQQELQPTVANYFPAYRCPCVPRHLSAAARSYP
jgi:hypothetical protein